MRYELFQAPAGFIHVYRPHGYFRTLCGKSIASGAWTFLRAIPNGRVAEDKATCRTCRTRALREHKKEVNARKRFPAGRMYVSLKTRGV